MRVTCIVHGDAYCSCSGSRLFPSELMRAVYGENINAKSLTVSDSKHYKNVEVLPNGRSVLKVTGLVQALYNGQSYRVPLIDIELATRGVVFQVNGKAASLPVYESPTPPEPNRAERKPDTNPVYNTPHTLYKLFGVEYEEERLIPSITNALARMSETEVANEIIKLPVSHTIFLPICQLYQKHEISAAATIILISSLLKNASLRSKTYTIPFFDSSEHKINLIHKTPSELIGIISLASSCLLTHLRNLIKELLLPLNLKGVTGIDLILSKILIISKDDPIYNTVMQKAKEL